MGQIKKSEILLGFFFLCRNKASYSMTLHIDIFKLGEHLPHVLRWSAVGRHRHFFLCTIADLEACLELLNILIALQHYKPQYYMGEMFIKI